MTQKKISKSSKNKPTLSKEIQDKVFFIWWIFFEVIPEIYNRFEDLIELWT